MHKPSSTNDLLCFINDDLKIVTVNATVQGVYFYRLEHPISGEIRYVGKTVKPYRRRESHISPCRNATFKHHLANWLRQLFAAGLKPIFRIIDYLVQEAAHQWEDRERALIGDYRAQGYPLTNIAEGGEGAASYGRLGKTNSPEHLAKTRAGRLGKPVHRKDPEGWAQRKREGTKRYYSELKQTGIIVKRGPASEETKRRISEANRARTSPKNAVIQLDLVGNELMRYDSQTAAAKAVGVSASCITSVLKGRTQTAAGFKWQKVT